MNEVPARTTPTTLSHFAKEGQWVELTSRLRRYLPAVMEEMGLGITLLEPLLHFLLQKAQGHAAGRLRDGLPSWLEEFRAGPALGLGRPLRPEEFRGLLERAAVREVLAPPVAPDAPPGAQALVQLLQQRGVSTWREVFRIDPRELVGPDADPGLGRYCEQQALAMRRETEERHLFFELA